mmetsp:Transcript_149/g.610  ORF Transcript_149/g.610 Transcript_149/m.610 type:complete len:203 (+) Transcript_149:40-648(+)
MRLAQRRCSAIAIAIAIAAIVVRGVVVVPIVAACLFLELLELRLERRGAERAPHQERTQRGEHECGQQHKATFARCSRGAPPLWPTRFLFVASTCHLTEHLLTRKGHPDATATREQRVRNGGMLIDGQRPVARAQHGVFRRGLRASIPWHDVLAEGGLPPPMPDRPLRECQRVRACCPKDVQRVLPAGRVGHTEAPLFDRQL